MLRGFIAGGLWGIVLGGLLLALTSQLADWRDLRPALTSDSTREEVLPQAPDELGSGLPDVTAALEAEQPERAPLPGFGGADLPGPEASEIEVAPPSTPAVGSVSGTAPEPAEPSESLSVTTEVTAAEPAANPAPRTETGFAAAAPQVDAAPQGIQTAAPSTPARLAPRPQVSVAEQPGPPDVSDEASGSPTAIETGTLSDLARPAQGLEREPSVQADAIVPADEPLAPPPAPKAPAAEAGPRVAALDASAVDAPAAPSRLDAPQVSATPDAAVAPLVPAAPDRPVAEDPPAAPSTAAADPQPVPQSNTRVDLPSPTESAPSQAPDVEPAPRRTAAAPVEMAQADPSAGASGATTLPKVNRIGRGSDTGGALPGVRIRRLPGATAKTPGIRASAPVAPSDEPGAASQGDAIRRNAERFDAGEETALVAVILVHDPGSVPEAIPVPVTFAVPADLPDAAGVAETYRAAGHEVVLIPDLPPRASAQDVEVNLSVTLDAVPGAVALLDADGTGFQSNRDATAQVIETASARGLGLVTIRQGFNTAQRLADREGVRSAQVLRELEWSVSDADAVGRELDQAALRARSEGRIVVLGHATAEQIAAIRDWSNGAGDDVAIAPLSAVLLAD